MDSNVEYKSIIPWHPCSHSGQSLSRNRSVYQPNTAPEMYPVSVTKLPSPATQHRLQTAVSSILPSRKKPDKKNKKKPWRLHQAASPHSFFTLASESYSCISGIVAMALRPTREVSLPRVEEALPERALEAWPRGLANFPSRPPSNMSTLTAQNCMVAILLRACCLSSSSSSSFFFSSRL